MVESRTSMSNRKWILDHNLLMERYLVKSKREDRPYIRSMIFNAFPDEGRPLIENYNLDPKQKFLLFLKWIVFSKQLTCLILGDQRMGKDGTVCYIFTEAIKYMESLGMTPPRIVTLGNIKKPPFVKDEDMYFSFLNIPSGSEKQEVWIYCSELESVLPAREGLAQENRLFSQLEGTMAQNHQKLFGCVKLASKVDLNVIRSSNAKVFKYISPEKLNVVGVERDNFLSGLGRWLLPQDINDKSQVLLAFNNQLFTISHPLPEWWSQDYSEQFREISLEKIYEFIDVVYSNDMDINSIRISVAQKFRKLIPLEELKAYVTEKFGEKGFKKKVGF